MKNILTHTADFIFAAAMRTSRMICVMVVCLHLVPVVPLAFAAVNTPSQTVKIVSTGNIHLSDVFPHIDLAKDAVIGTAPQPGRDIVLNARALMKLAAAYGVSWAPVTPTDSVTLRADGVVIDTTIMTPFLKQAIADTGLSGPFDLIFSESVVPITLPKGSSSDVVITDVHVNPATQTFEARVGARALPGTSMLVTGTIDPVLNIPVARGTIARGDIISPTSIDIIQVNQSKLGTIKALSANDVVGQSARRALTSGKMIGVDDVEEALLVKRGDKISVLYHTGVLELVAQGRAGQDGRKGDRIKIVNIDSNKNLQGTVTDDHVVVID